MTGITSTAQRERFRELLLAERREAEERLASQSEGITAVRDARSDGSVDDEHNVNGSTGSIAGVRNREGNVVGLMPHPEHAVDPDVGPTGGQPMFASLLSFALARV